MGITGYSESKSDIYIKILADTFGKIIYGETTHADWQELLDQALHNSFQGKELPAPIFLSPPADRLFLMNTQMDELTRNMHSLETLPLREAVAFFEESIENRSNRGDIWLEGMLELGVAWLALEEYDRAERVLQRLVRICESGGELSEESLMAA